MSHKYTCLACFSLSLLSYICLSHATTTTSHIYKITNKPTWDFRILHCPLLSSEREIKLLKINMTISHHHSHSHGSCNNPLLSLLLLILLLIHAASCSATMRLREKGSSTVMMNENYDEKKRMMVAFVFNFFPKGSPIPPSAPSKRHNSLLHSKPHNWFIHSSITMTIISY